MFRGGNHPSLRMTSLELRGAAIVAKFSFFYIATAVLRVLSLVQGRQPPMSLRVTSLELRGAATLVKFSFFYIATAILKSAVPCSGEATTQVVENDFP